MILKNNLDKFIIHNQQFEELLRRVEDAVYSVMNSNSLKVLFFVNDTEIEIVKNALNHFVDVEYTLSSKICNSEYKLLSIHSNEYQIDNEELTILFSLKYNTKFTSITHPDVLGSLMSLGIKRNMIGDILVIDNIIYFEIAKSLERNIIDNLLKIKKTKVLLDIISDDIEKKQEYLISNVQVRSFRLDSIVSSITKLSRQEVKNQITSGNVKLNQIIMYNFSKEINDEDVVSIKRFGRYKIELNKNKQTKKGNYNIKVCKYI